MTWRIGDQGFDIALSSYVPKIIARTSASWSTALADGGLSCPTSPRGRSTPGEVDHRPGAEDPRTSDDQVSASREVLRRCET